MGVKTTPRVGLIYPTEYTPNWYNMYESHMLQLDAALYASREDRGIILMGGGVVTWDSTTGDLTFSEDALVVGPIVGTIGTITADTFTIGEGEFAYVDVTRYASAGYALEVVVTTTVPNTDNALLIAYRKDDFLWLRGVGVLSGIYSQPLSREGLTDFPDPGDGGAVVNASPYSKNVRFTIAPATAETMTVADAAYLGQELCLVAETVGGGGTRQVTFASPVDGGGSTNALFNAVGDLLYLRSFQVVAGTLRWRISINTSVGLS